MSDFVKVRVPGTTANCGPGFDVMGIACSIYNELELKLLEEKNLCIEIYGDGATNIPCDERNMVWRSYGVHHCQGYGTAKQGEHQHSSL